LESNNFECVKREEIDECCYYTDATSCNKGDIDIRSDDGRRKGCIFKGNRCEDFSCEDYSVSDGDNCINNNKNIIGGCFVEKISGVSTCKNITACKEISIIKECIKHPLDSCWIIEGKCENKMDCGTKVEKEKCKSGCKHSKNEVTSSCEVDLCTQYDLNTCSEVSGCDLFDGFCVDVIESSLCENLVSVESCLKRSDCDMFAKVGCSKKVFYDGNCSVVGEDVCLNTSTCVWKGWNGGCVVYVDNNSDDDDDGGDDDKKAENRNSNIWIVAFIGLLNFILIFLFLFIFLFKRFIFSFFNF
jgi:hypothetical protein